MAVAIGSWLAMVQIGHACPEWYALHVSAGMGSQTTRLDDVPGKGLSQQGCKRVKLKPGPRDVTIASQKSKVTFVIGVARGPSMSLGKLLGVAAATRPVKAWHV